MKVFHKEHDRLSIGNYTIIDTIKESGNRSLYLVESSVRAKGLSRFAWKSDKQTDSSRGILIASIVENEEDRIRLSDQWIRWQKINEPNLAICSDYGSEKTDQGDLLFAFCAGECFLADELQENGVFRKDLFRCLGDLVQGIAFLEKHRFKNIQPDLWGIVRYKGEWTFLPSVDLEEGSDSDSILRETALLFVSMILNEEWSENIDPDLLIRKLKKCLKDPWFSLFRRILLPGEKTLKISDLLNSDLWFKEDHPLPSPVSCSLSSTIPGSKTLEWESIPDEDVIVRQVDPDDPSLKKIGEIILASEIDSMGDPVSIQGNHLTVPVHRQDRMMFLPFRKRGLFARIGKPVFLEGVPSVIFSRLETGPKLIKIDLDWPKNILCAFVLLRPDRFAESHTDPRAEIYEYPRDDSFLYSLNIPRPPWKKIYLSAYSVVRRANDSELVSSGLNPDARRLIEIPVSVSLSLIPPPFFRINGIYRLIIHVDRPVVFPDLLLVAKKGNRPPEKVSDGEMIFRITSFACSGESIFEFHSSGSERPPFTVRLFPEDPIQEKEDFVLPRKGFYVKRRFI